jgi:hypothetical protein
MISSLVYTVNGSDHVLNLLQILTKEGRGLQIARLDLLFPQLQQGFERLRIDAEPARRRGYYLMFIEQRLLTGETQRVTKQYAKRRYGIGHQSKQQVILRENATRFLT